MLFMAKLKVAAVVLVAGSLLGGSTGVVVYRAWAEEQPEPPLSKEKPQPRLPRPEEKADATSEVRWRKAIAVPNGAGLLAFSPDGQRLAVATGRGIVLLDSAMETGKWAAQGGWVRSLSFSPDGKLLASCGNDCHVRVWETDSGKQIHAWNAESWSKAQRLFFFTGRCVSHGLRHERSVLGCPCGQGTWRDFKRIGRNFLQDIGRCAGNKSGRGTPTW